jgi:hypothetical protein
MQQAVVHLATEVPYDTAQSLFRDLTGMSCESERMHTVTDQVGEQLTVLDVAPARGDPATHGLCVSWSLPPPGIGAGH